MSKNVIHKHNPDNGKHLCGSLVEKCYLDKQLWFFGNCLTNLGGVDKTQNYIGKKWCCENDWDMVTCKACLKLKGKKIIKRKDGVDWDTIFTVFNIHGRKNVESNID